MVKKAKKDKQAAIQPPPIQCTPAELNATNNIETIVSAINTISVSFFINCFLNNKNLHAN